MNYRYSAVLFLCLFVIGLVCPGGPGRMSKNPSGSMCVAYAEQLKMKSDNSNNTVKQKLVKDTSDKKDLLVVAIVVLTVWCGVALLLFYIERKLVKIEKELK